MFDCSAAPTNRFELTSTPIRSSSAGRDHHRASPGSPTCSTSPRTPFLILRRRDRGVRCAVGETVKADFAQVNLASVLFAVVNEVGEARSGASNPQDPEEALISIPPFKIDRQIHLMPERNFRVALSS